MNDKPIVKAFIHKGCFFMYTPYSNYILRITQGQFKELRCLEKLGFKEYMFQRGTTSKYSDLVSLIESGFITKSFIEEVKHPATDDYVAIVNRSMKRLVLQITQRCNFSCRYCHNIHNKSARFISEKSDMSWNVAKRSIDFFLEHSQDSETIDIYFYGGEPLLNFDLIKRVVEYIEIRINTKKVTYHITTNGSLLTEEIAQFFYTYRFKVAISLDGAEERQDWARKFANGDCTFDVVWDNVQMLHALYKDHHEDIMFLPVVFVDEDKKNVLDFFKSNNIDQNRILFLNANTSGIDYLHGVLSTAEAEDGIINSNWVDYDNIDEKEFNDFLVKYNNKHTVGRSWHHAGACIPGYFKIFVDTKGFFYPCENAPNCSDTCIGNLNDGIDVERASALLNIGTLTKNECLNCWAIRFCSMCALYCMDEEKCCTSREIKHLNCVAQKKHILKLLKKYIDSAYFASEGDNG